MKVKKTVDMENSSMVITKEYEMKLLETCDKDEPIYDSRMVAFEQMLQKLADEAFRLGIENGN